jgi:hypothetical protein
MTAKEELRRLLGELSDEQAQQVLDYLRELLRHAETREAIGDCRLNGVDHGTVAHTTVQFGQDPVEPIVRSAATDGFVVHV